MRTVDEVAPCPSHALSPLPRLFGNAAAYNIYSVKEPKLKSCITSVLESNSCSAAHIAKVLLDQDKILGDEAPELSAQIRALVTVLTQ